MYGRFTLLKLSEYIVKVSGPVWFSLKKESSFKQDLTVILKLLVIFGYLSSDRKKVIKPVIQTKAFHAHPKNLLLAMLNDDQPWD